MVITETHLYEYKQGCRSSARAELQHSMTYISCDSVNEKIF